MLKKAFLSLLISNLFDPLWAGMSLNPLAAHAFGARNLPRLVLKSGYVYSLIHVPARKAKAVYS